MNEKFLKPYDPKDTEDRIYKLWEESGLFNPDECIKKGFTDKNAEKFSMVLPPPNVTGVLHLGHATTVAIEDIMVRFNRMRGKKTLWIPGTDHAAIATQTLVEKKLAKEGINKHEIGRGEFLKHVEKFASESHDTIVSQIRKLGASLDWSREAFTLDQPRVKAVQTAFKRMYDDGLIYRGHRVVNWDPKGQTVVSDDEVEHEERKAKLYTFKYSKDFPISIATTRPETKLGDTAVAVNPKDKRYVKYIGEEFVIENFAGTPLTIKIIGDDAIDPEFGTGAIGVTPAHSMTDWEIAQRHDLPLIQVINEYAKMTVGMEGVKDQKGTVAREKIVEWLENEGLMDEIKEIDQNISIAERSKGVIEPLPKLQWFVDVNKTFKMAHSDIPGLKAGQEISLKGLMIHVVKESHIKIIPNQFEKVYFHWINNLRDWTISRQIWYGHRIPVWYKGEEIYVGVDAPEGDGWEQDPDVLDTWFSSGLWTFSTLGWPDETDDLKTYHPTNVLETGRDIIFTWVARMILMSGYLIGQIPFETVYLHGLVLDKHGKKMSKSRPETAIDPLKAIEQYGADALRMALVVGIGPGSDITFTDDKIRAYKKFTNKIWNASRFVLESIQDVNILEKPPLTIDDKNNLDMLDDMMKEITKEMEDCKFYIVGEKLYHFFWHTFADVIIEKNKEVIQNGTPEEKISAQYTLYTMLTTLLKALHPFMPFATEEIWESLPESKKLLLVENWPHER